MGMASFDREALIVEACNSYKKYYMYIYIYSIAGNFCEVHIFTDRLVSAKTKTMGIVTSCKKVSRSLERAQIHRGHEN